MSFDSNECSILVNELMHTCEVMGLSFKDIHFDVIGLWFFTYDYDSIMKRWTNVLMPIPIRGNIASSQSRFVTDNIPRIKTRSGFDITVNESYIYDQII